MKKAEILSEGSNMRLIMATCLLLLIAAPSMLSAENRVDLACPAHPSTPGDSVIKLPIYWSNDTPLGGITLTFSWDSDAICFLGQDNSGTEVGIPYFFSDPVVDSAGRRVCVEWLDFTGGMYVRPTENGYFCTLLFKVIAEVGPTCVDIDSTSMSPAHGFYFSDVVTGPLTPAYYDCGVCDIILGQCGFRGDVNLDCFVSIADAIYMIVYVFDSGPPPEPVLSGDADCDGAENISDAIYIIQYIFSSGPPPGDPDGDGLPDCW
ncbi:MAG: dockerin type I repeat-containing protein [bacterium]